MTTGDSPNKKFPSTPREGILARRRRRLAVRRNLREELPKIGSYKRPSDKTALTSVERDLKFAWADQKSYQLRPITKESEANDAQKAEAKGMKDQALDMAAGVAHKAVDKAMEMIPEQIEQKVASTISQKAVDALKNFYYAMKDAVDRRRPKTSALVLTGMVIGAVVGGVLGFGVGAIPGIAIGAGTAVGIAATVSAIGTAIGSAAIFGYMGASMLANRFFKEERYYDLSQPVTTKMAKLFYLKTNTLNLMSAYLYNRANGTGNKEEKQYLERLHNGVFVQMDPEFGQSSFCLFYTGEKKSTVAYQFKGI